MPWGELNHTPMCTICILLLHTLPHSDSGMEKNNQQELLHDDTRHKSRTSADTVATTTHLSTTASLRDRHCVDRVDYVGLWCVSDERNPCLHRIAPDGSGLPTVPAYIRCLKLRGADMSANSAGCVVDGKRTRRVFPLFKRSTLMTEGQGRTMTRAFQNELRETTT